MKLPFRIEIDVDETFGPPASALSAPAGEGPTEQETLALLRRATRLEPREADYYFILGDALARMGHHHDAIPALEEAIRLSSGNATYSTALGSVLSRLGRYAEALAAFQDALRLQPDDPRCLNALGAPQLRLGRAGEARETFGRAVRLDRTLAEAQGNLGIALWQLGHTTAALRAFRKASRLRPASGAYQHHLGLALSALGRYDEALKCFRARARLRPETAEAHLDLGDTLFALGRHAEAEAAYERASVLEPGALASRARSCEARAVILVERVRREIEPELARGSAWRAFFALSAAWQGLLAALVSCRRHAGRALGLLLVVGLGRAGWVLAPLYVNHYRFRDAVVQAARAPLKEDGEVLERLMHAVRGHGLESRVREGSFQIHTVPRWRTVSCDYEVPVQILPGVTRSLHFSIRVEEPFILPEGRTQFFQEPLVSRVRGSQWESFAAPLQSSQAGELA